jgi:hypothetical protein
VIARRSWDYRVPAGDNGVTVGTGKELTFLAVKAVAEFHYLAHVGHHVVETFRFLADF